MIYFALAFLLLISVVSGHDMTQTENTMAQMNTLWSPAIVIHALLMIVICFVLFPIGVMLAIGQNRLHKYWQSGAIVVCFLAIIPAVTSVSRHLHSVHSILAILLLIGIGFQFLLGWVIKIANFQSIPIPRSKWLHKAVAVLLLFCLPIVVIFGFAHVANIAEEDVDNFAAHLGFGIPLILAGLLLQIPALARYFYDTRKRLLVEYYVWLMFGIIIVLSQHDWFGDGFNNLSGDLQHVLIGMMSVICSVCGILLVSIANTDFITSSRIPIFLLYLMLGTMMSFHNQSSVYGSFLHVTFGIVAIVIGALHLFQTEEQQQRAKSMIHNFLMIICGTLFCGAAYTNVHNITAYLHPPMYLLVLFLIALVIETWWVMMIHYFTKAYEMKAQLLPVFTQIVEMEAVDKVQVSIR